MTTKAGGPPKTIYVNNGGDEIDVDMWPGGLQAELTITVDGVEVNVSLADSERRELIRALGGRL